MSITTTSFGFMPTNIPGCRLWFDGADPAGNGVIPANGASIATWVDKSGNGQNLSGIGSSTAGTFAGLRIVNFNSSYFQNGSFTQSGPLTIILIGKMNSLGSDWQTFSDNVAGLRPYVGMQAGSPPLRTAFRFGGTATTNVEIWTLTFSASDNTVFNVNGSDVRGAATGYGGIGFTNGIRLGLAANATAYLVGWIGEYIVYNTNLSISQYQQLESYLSQKWGITTSLPGGHPGLTSTVYRSTYLRNSGVKRNIATMTPFFTGFSPRRISGLGLWLDGADSSSITTVTGVSQWNDKSGNGYNLTQGSTGSQPTRTGNLLNFVSNYNMNIPQAAVNNASTWSMFFLVNPIASVNWFMAKQRDGVNSYNIFSTTQTGGPGPNAYFTGSTNFLYVRMFNAGTLAASAAALTMSQLQLLAFIYDGTSMFIYINGNLSSTTVGSFAIQNDTSATNFLLGQWFGNGTNYNSNGNFQLGELVYYNTFLSATQLQQRAQQLQLL
jgi:hypothetical protein